MNTVTLITLSPNELQQIVIDAIEIALKRATVPSSPKLLLTTKEVGDQLGYSTKTVLDLIHNGRKARSGENLRLPVTEITTGDFRIRTEDLTAWVSHF